MLSGPVVRRLLPILVQADKTRHVTQTLIVRSEPRSLFFFAVHMQGRSHLDVSDVT